MALRANDFLCGADRPTATANGNLTNIFDNFGDVLSTFRVRRFRRELVATSTTTSESDSRRPGLPLSRRTERRSKTSTATATRSTSPAAPPTSTATNHRHAQRRTSPPAGSNLDLLGHHRRRRTATSASPIAEPRAGHEYLPSGIFVREFDGTGASRDELRPNSPTSGRSPSTRPTATSLIAYLGEQARRRVRPRGRIPRPDRRVRPAAASKASKGVAVNRRATSTSPTTATARRRLQTAADAADDRLRSRHQPDHDLGDAQRARSTPTAAATSPAATSSSAPKRNSPRRIRPGDSALPARPGGGSFSAPTQVHADFSGLTTEHDLPLPRRRRQRRARPATAPTGPSPPTTCSASGPSRRPR